MFFTYPPSPPPTPPAVGPVYAFTRRLEVKWSRAHRCTSAGTGVDGAQLRARELPCNGHDDTIIPCCCCCCRYFSCFSVVIRFSIYFFLYPFVVCLFQSNRLSAASLFHLLLYVPTRSFFSSARPPNFLLLLLLLLSSLFPLPPVCHSVSFSLAVSPRFPSLSDPVFHPSSFLARSLPHRTTNPPDTRVRPCYNILVPRAPWEPLVGR